MSTGWESQPASGGDNIASVDDSAPTKVILAPFPSSSPLPDTPVQQSDLGSTCSLLALSILSLLPLDEVECWDYLVLGLSH